MGIIWGYSVMYLTLWREMYIGEEIAYLRFSGWAAMLLPAGSVAHGVTRLQRGFGGRTAALDVPLILVPQDDDYVPEPLAYIKLAAREGPRISLPGDVLFDFDSVELRSEAITTLTYLADLLNNRRRVPVTLEGHTDSIGSAAYNLELSTRRAAAVKRWLIGKGVYGAEAFLVHGYGESRLVAPEVHPDGSPDPVGRRRNRRVVVQAHWMLSQ
jgi:outer membrane protein OmpA-like peptidoglycan-associated protein